jgi:hypothetical protein
MQLGPLSLRIGRHPREWLLWGAVGPDPLSTEYRPPAICPESEPPPEDVHRVVAAPAESSLRLTPRLADQAVVARPVTSLSLMPRSAATVYVSTPLTVAIETTGGVLVKEYESALPKRTWVGSNTRVGVLCYSSRTSAQLDLAHLRFRPGRAVTALALENESEAVVPLDRVSIPVTQLSLFADAGGRLWTERIGVRIHGDDPLEVKLDEAPPRDAGTTERISGPRVRPHPQLLRRVFSALFS